MTAYIETEHSPATHLLTTYSIGPNSRQFGPLGRPTAHRTLSCNDWGKYNMLWEHDASAHPACHLAPVPDAPRMGTDRAAKVKKFCGHGHGCEKHATGICRLFLPSCPSGGFSTGRVRFPSFVIKSHSFFEDFRGSRTIAVEASEVSPQCGRRGRPTHCIRKAPMTCEVLP